MKTRNVIFRTLLLGIVAMITFSCGNSLDRELEKLQLPPSDTFMGVCGTSSFNWNDAIKADTELPIKPHTYASQFPELSLPLTRIDFEQKGEKLATYTSTGFHRNLYLVSGFTLGEAEFLLYSNGRGKRSEFVVLQKRYGDYSLVVSKLSELPTAFFGFHDECKGQLKKAFKVPANDQVQE